MKKVILSPGKYIQGYKEILNLNKYSQVYGDKPLIIMDKFVYDNFNKKILESFNGKVYYLECFSGSSTQSEIERLVNISREKNCDVIIGVGGGSNSDASKAVAHYLKLPIIVVPTLASTNASCSKLSVIYNSDGQFERYLSLRNNPEIVLVDTEIIAKSPIRFLVSGIGDALATKFEARAVKKSKSKNYSGGICSDSALELANLCYKIILSDGKRAISSVSNGYSTDSLDKLIEATIYLSAIGSESGGLAAAHSIHNGFTNIGAINSMYHGEIVAFSVICQLVLEGAKKEEIYEVIDFCSDIGLPTNLKKLGVTSVNDAEWEIFLKTALKKNETIYNMPFKLTPLKLKEAILTADKLGS